MVTLAHGYKIHTILTCGVCRQIIAVDVTAEWTVYPQPTPSSPYQIPDPVVIKAAKKMGWGLGKNASEVTCERCLEEEESVIAPPLPMAEFSWKKTWALVILGIMILGMTIAAFGCRDHPKTKVFREIHRDYSPVIGEISVVYHILTDRCFIITGHTMMETSREICFAEPK